MMKLHSALSILRLYNNFLTMFHLIASSSSLQLSSRERSVSSRSPIRLSPCSRGLVGNFIKSKTHCLTK